MIPQAQVLCCHVAAWGGGACQVGGTSESGTSVCGGQHVSGCGISVGEGDTLQAFIENRDRYLYRVYAVFGVVGRAGGSAKLCSCKLG